MTVKVEHGMSLVRYLLIKLAEESSELTKAATKAANFGLRSLNPKESKRSNECIDDEFIDVLAVMAMLHDLSGEAVASPVKHRDTETGKKILLSAAAKLHYASVAISAGILIPTVTEKRFMDQTIEMATAVGWVPSSYLVENYELIRD